MARISWVQQSESYEGSFEEGILSTDLATVAKDESDHFRECGVPADAIAAIEWRKAEATDRDETMIEAIVPDAILQWMDAEEIEYNVEE